MPESLSDDQDGAVGFQRVPTVIVYGGIAFFVTLIAVHHQSTVISSQHSDDIISWLKESGLNRFQKLLTVNNDFEGPVHLASLVNEDGEFGIEVLNGAFKSLDAAELEILGEWFLQLKNDLILQQWLQENKIQSSHWKALRSVNVTSLAELVQKYQESTKDLVGDLTSDAWKAFSRACERLSSQNDLNQVRQTLWKHVLQENKSSWGILSATFVSLLISILVGMAATMSQPSFFLDHSTATKLGFLTFVTGKYLAPQNCKIEFCWNEPQVVGSTVKFVIRFFQRNGRVYPISNKDNLLVEITQGTHKMACSTELGGTDPNDANKACVKFSVRRAGDYTISVLVGMVHIRGSPFTKHFLSGPPDPQKTGFVHHCSTVVCTESVPYHLFIEPRDKYSNVCATESTSDPSDEYTVDIVEINTERPIHSSFRWECHPHLSRISLVLKLEQEGIYRALVSFRGVSLQNGDFHIIVLNKADGALVQKNVAKKSHNIWYEAKLLSKNGDNLGKPRKVFCYVSPKQLTIKEYVLKIIPKRLITFRLCPSTKFQFKSSNNQYIDDVLVVDDGCQPQVELLTPDRSVIAATFTQFLLKNIGGSETFKDKQDFFYHEVRKLHQKHFHDKLPLKVQRDKLLDSSMKSMKGFSTSDWCKNLEITFLGEQGLDWGGLRREWFELICSNLFDSENLLFQRFKNDKQGLVHPNSKRPPHLKLKHFEFAGRIVGKCLYESALGSSYRQLVKARFSRSFLAQLIGLRVHYKYFEQDDPDLFVSKIKYIIENDVSQMDLLFVEEEYGDNGQLLKVIELIPNGSNVVVNNTNKYRYLDSLAQHRLTNNVKEEVESFLKGLNELIPDNLLCIFDENELELLMCGTGQYSIADFKANHAVSGASYEFRKILDWFWTAVSNFTEEEMARLLQFTTGCSQLPPGGFGELNPRFHITAAPTFGNLPTAHTCFNQLCLPDYDCYEQFERALRLAVNEGSEGFGMV